MVRDVDGAAASGLDSEAVLQTANQINPTESQNESRIVCFNVLLIKSLFIKIFARLVARPYRTETFLSQLKSLCLHYEDILGSFILHCSIVSVPCFRMNLLWEVITQNKLNHSLISLNP